MTSAQPQAVLIVLTDGEANLAHYMDLLRSEGIRVLATARPYDAIAQLARYERSVLLVRHELLGADAADFLRQARALQTEAFILISVGAEVDVSACDSMVDLVLREPYLYSAFKDAVECGNTKRDRLRRPTERGSAIPAEVFGPNPATGAVLLNAGANGEWQRVAEFARRLSCEERDRAKLITLALQMFMDIGSANSGALWLKVGNGESWDLVEQSAPGDELSDAVPISGAAAAALLHGHPALTTSELLPASATLLRAPLLLIPLIDQQDHHGLVALAEPHGEPFTTLVFPELEALALQFVANLTNASRLKELDNMAVVDPLTGLFNRRYFDRIFVRELQRAKRHMRKLTLVLLDVDKFKTINDLNGYSTGDAVIRSVADVILRGFRSEDTVTRWGGDEFAVLLPESVGGNPATIGLSEHADPVNRVRSAVERHDFSVQIPRLKGKVTISAGVAVFPEDGTDRDTLFAAANRALQRAKRCGPNRVVHVADVRAGDAKYGKAEG